ncbi:DUF4142 domain-containing protein [Streptomyces bambusae]|uniref:DUF4142 domain-containing protein n=1 Tax=Streptomyces bambusae TaxID=1550616 RepID=UPI001CFD37CD|nr:DUF4142 domain-containing protein [Streptomyces bambusae]MCB5166746.1 DUF4142 domain-containing protein [Streptomyces bambusae]
MRPSVRRTLTSGRGVGTLLVVGALAATLAALLVPVHSFGQTRGQAAAGAPFTDDGRGTVSTPYGPLTPQDRDFVRRVRLAGLWELPAGREAMQRGGRESVRTAGEHLVMGHTELDRRALKTGEVLDIPLPDRPNAEQQGWLDQLHTARGERYEQLFANLLRAAHGKVFALVAQVRANSRNAMVRSLATVTNSVVLDHITVLEDTGLVDYDALSKGR